MKEETKTKLDIDEIIAAWKAGVNEDRSLKYKRDERQGHLNYLMDFFIANGIDRDTAQGAKRQVVEILVTPTGMKDKEKHKGWKKNTEEDYDDTVSRTYIPPPPKIEGLRGSHVFDPKVVEWAKSKFGKEVDQEIIKACHQPMNVYHLMFLNDYFKRNTGGLL